VFGYGRKPEYLRWTTTLEHQLFAAEPNPPEIPKNFGKRKAGPTGTYTQFQKTPSLNPANQPITVEAWVTSTRPQGVIIARGGPADGFALSLKNGRPEFHIRSNDKLTTVTAKKRIIGGWHHVVGVLDKDKSMKVYVDGELSAEGTASGLIKTDPIQPMEIGTDGLSAVGNYTNAQFTGIIDEVRLYFLAANAEQIAKRHQDGSEISSNAALAVSFDDGTARDLGLNRNDGTVEGAKLVDGKVGMAFQYSGKKKGGNANAPGNSLVDPKWTEDVPIYVRSMLLSGGRLFIVGPPDIIDEESTFQKLTEKDEQVQKLLAEQDEVLNGTKGSLLLSVNIDTGKIDDRIELTSLPAWDSLAGAEGKLFLSTLDGSVICFGSESE